MKKYRLLKELPGAKEGWIMDVEILVNVFRVKFNGGSFMGFPGLPEMYPDWFEEVKGPQMLMEAVGEFLKHQICRGIWVDSIPDSDVFLLQFKNLRSAYERELEKYESRR